MPKNGKNDCVIMRRNEWLDGWIYTIFALKFHSFLLHSNENTELFVCNCKSWGNFLESMVISISNASTSQESGVKNPSPTPIMEDTAGFVPPSPTVAEETVQLLVIQLVTLWLDPPGVSKRKQYGTRKKETSPPTIDEEVIYASMILDYVPPKPSDAPTVILDKNAKYQLVALGILKGVRKMTNIIPNL